jgi:hypothetical protein
MVLMCMPHQMPTYFIGFTQLTSPSAFGGFRLRPSTDGTRPASLSASWIVRHGVFNGVRPRTFTPSARGASDVRSVRSSMCR